MTDGAQTWANVDVAFKDGYQRGLSEGRKAGLMEAVEIADVFVNEPDPYDHGSCAGIGWEACAVAIRKAIEAAMKEATDGKE